MNMSQQPKAELVSKFLSGLPSHDPENFRKFANKEPKESITKKPKTYVSTRDSKTSQTIVTDKANILLRFLRQQAEKEDVDRSSGAIKKPLDKFSPGEEVSYKRPRRD